MKSLFNEDDSYTKEASILSEHFNKYFRDVFETYGTECYCRDLRILLEDSMSLQEIIYRSKRNIKQRIYEVSVENKFGYYKYFEE